MSDKEIEDKLKSIESVLFWMDKHVNNMYHILEKYMPEIRQDLKELNKKDK